MIIYVNGDSHSAGAEAVNKHCFAEDDPLYWALGRRPHPDNERASYGCEVANYLGAILECDAESASSNDRIIRTTWQRLQSMPDGMPDLVIIGWSTWEREEWSHNGKYYQVTASGTDQVPAELKTQYMEWVVEQNAITKERKLLNWHERIFGLHTSLLELNIPHLFFNTYSDFSKIRNKEITTYNAKESPLEYDWSGHYLEPYDQNYTYYYWCLANGFKTVNPNSYHFGADAHCAWAEFLLQNYVQNILTK